MAIRLKKEKSDVLLFQEVCVVWKKLGGECFRISSHFSQAT